jgi:hypothetical protein
MIHCLTMISLGHMYNAAVQPICCVQFHMYCHAGQTCFASRCLKLLCLPRCLYFCDSQVASTSVPLNALNACTSPCL